MVIFKDEGDYKEVATIKWFSSEKLDGEQKVCVTVTISVIDILLWGAILLNLIPVKIKSI